jgi:hypothetical protein
MSMTRTTQRSPDVAIIAARAMLQVIENSAPGSWRASRPGWNLAACVHAFV